MASNIEWTDETWNPVVGCTKISPGCAHCYAETMANRIKGMALTDIAEGRDPGKKRHYIEAIDDKGRWTGKLVPAPESLADPLTWRKPRQVFVNSMSDLFHESVPFEYIAAVFGVMAASPKHTFQILTKRAERMAEWSAWIADKGGIGRYIRSRDGRAAVRGHFDDVLKTVTVNGKTERHPDDPWMQVMNGAACNYGNAPLHNVWLGVSVENQKAADERIPHLLKTSAAVRFLSCEPLLGPVELGHLRRGEDDAFNCLDGIGGPNIDWVIVGGESGHSARPCDVDWIRSIRDQCQAAGVPVFIKQLGTACTSNLEIELSATYAYSGKPADPKGGDMNEWPEDLRVRQFPQLQEQP